MALNSPGVEVKVINESFYVPAEPSTRPLIVFASTQNKPNGSGTGVAQGTLAANAGTPYLVSSQRELTELFGTPLFYQDSSQNPIHGGELNEYGLQAAYSFLGVANSAYVMRADINLSELVSRATAPGANPEAGTYWFDTANTHFGIFEWNGSAATVPGGQKFANKVPLVITDLLQVDELTGAPLTSIGTRGDYAILATSNLNKLFYKNREGNWVLVGSNDWSSSWPTIRSTVSNPSITSGHSIIINGVTISASGTTISELADNITGMLYMNGITAAVVSSKLEIYSNGAVDSPQMDSSASNIVDIAPGSGSLLEDLGIEAGKYNGPALSIGPHTQVPRFKLTDFGIVDSQTVSLARPTGSVWIKTTNVNLGAHWRVKLWNTASASWNEVAAPLYANGQDALYRLDRSGGGINIPTGSLYVQYNFDEDYGTDSTPRVATFRIHRRVAKTATTVVSKIIDATTFNNDVYSFSMAETLVGDSNLLSSFTFITLIANGNVDDSHVVATAINNAGFDNIIASVNAQNKVVITHKTGGDIRFKDHQNSILGMLFTPYDLSTNTGTVNLYQDPQNEDWYIASNWKPLSYIADPIAPLALPENGRLWYSSVMDEVDIMIHNGTNWVSYLDSTSPFFNDDENLQTDPMGPIVSATRPDKDTGQSDGSPLAAGDIWIDSSDLENYPLIHKWDNDNKVWVALDKTDQTTEDGIVFADARWSTNGGLAGQQFDPATIEDLLHSNFLDFDAPDPDLYPRGMLLFNTRRSGFNVKKFVRDYISPYDNNVRYEDESMTDYYRHRWVNESGNSANGEGLFGRKAQRKVVVKHLKSVFDSSIKVRDWERITFNLIACPGYPELISNMVNLNIDRKQTAFVVGDSPFRLANDSTSLNDWGSNMNLASDDGEDGLVTYDEYLGVYYPSGLSTDNLGNTIVVPPSHMVLRTIALSDNVSFPWFAPAGTRRGGVSNATSIGYIDSESGEFQSIALNESQRDTLYAVDINPITFLTGQGIIVFGQKTRARAASALDRINVARLVVYLRGQLDTLAKPYIFEPNDKITRDELKSSADSLMLELVGQRALYDFITVCDESNNTPSRIDRNELYLDIAIEPVKAVEFIYIPLRLKNTGTISGLGK